MEDILLEVTSVYRTSIKTVIGHTPFALAFGLEALAPSELVWPIGRVLGYNEEHIEEVMVEEEIRSRFGRRPY